MKEKFSRDDRDKIPTMGLECYYCGSRQLAAINEYKSGEDTHNCPALNGQKIKFVTRNASLRMKMSSKMILDGSPTDTAMTSLSRGSNTTSPIEFAPFEDVPEFDPLR